MSEPIFYRYRARWFYVLVYLDTFILSTRERFGPFPSLDAAMTAASNW